MEGVDQEREHTQLAMPKTCAVWTFAGKVQDS